ncbi:MAG: hypothetical protein M3O33_10080 [Cyanobacteriota bacterium]|nr:hypothetical protein [Cyanobacteriota bacterium]
MAKTQVSERQTRHRMIANSLELNMERSPLREHYEALTAKRYQIIGAEVLVRHLNNVKTV